MWNIIFPSIFRLEVDWVLDSPILFSWASLLYPGLGRTTICASLGSRAIWSLALRVSDSVGSYQLHSWSVCVWGGDEFVERSCETSSDTLILSQIHFLLPWKFYGCWGARLLMTFIPLWERQSLNSVKNCSKVKGIWSHFCLCVPLGNSCSLHLVSSSVQQI